MTRTIYCENGYKLKMDMHHGISFSEAIKSAKRIVKESKGKVIKVVDRTVIEGIEFKYTIRPEE